MKEFFFTSRTSIFRYEDVVLSNTGHSHENARSQRPLGASSLIESHPRDTDAVTNAVELRSRGKKLKVTCYVLRSRSDREYMCLRCMSECDLSNLMDEGYQRL